jgi:hypothetical protein
LELEKSLPNSILIEQDHFYKGNRADHTGYLEEIRNMCGDQKNNKTDHSNKRRKVANHPTRRVLLLCKNHHTKQHLQEVLDILEEESVAYYIINLVPDVMDEENISKLLERIEKRKTYSHLVIDTSSASKSYKRARCILMKGFVEKYEKPTQPHLHLSFLSPLSENIEKILKYISI